MDAFIGEVRVFGFPYAPRNWALCAGQLMSISQNTALFSLLGTFYGGDGRSTFALPNLQGNVPVHVGGAQPGPGLQTWNLGEQQGTPNVTLLLNQLPTHNHSLMAVNSAATTLDPSNASLAEGVVGQTRGQAAPYYQAAAPNVQMSPMGVGPIGGSQPHNNMMPFLAMNYCICLYGIFPTRP